MIILFVFLFLIVITIQRSLKLMRLSVFFVFNASWLITLILYELNLSVFPEIDLASYSYLLSYLLLFNISYFIFYLVISNHKKINPSHGFSICDKSGDASILHADRFFSDYLFIAWLVLLVVFFYQISKSYGVVNYLIDGGARKILSNLNESDDSSINISYYIFGTLFVIFRLVEWELHNINLTKIAILKVVVVCFSLLLTAAKVNFVYLCMIIYFIYFIVKNKTYFNLIGHVSVLVSIFYLFIIAFAFFTGKVIDENVGSMESFDDVFRLGKSTLLYPYDYLVGALAAFNEFFIHKPNMEQSEFGSYMFKRVYQLLSLIVNKNNLPSLPPSQTPFVNINGINTNVYTMHYFIVNDLGPYLAIIFSVVQGVYFSWLDFIKANCKNTSFNVLFYLTLANTVLSLITFKFSDTLYFSAICIFFISHIINYQRAHNA